MTTLLGEAGSPRVQPAFAAILPGLVPMSPSTGLGGPMSLALAGWCRSTASFLPDQKEFEMNRKTLSASLFGVLAIAGLTSSAVAADLPRKSVAPAPFAQPVPIFTWTGFYVGLNAGYAFDTGKSQLTGSPALLGTGLAPIGSAKTMGDGFTIGGTIGYNYQISPNFVAGIEADLAWMDLGKSVVGGVAPLGVTLSQDMTYFGTVRGRLGVTFDRFMVYATGGLAFGDTKSTTTITVPGSLWTGSKNDTRFGWTLGAGVEYALTNNWSTKIEYLYYDLGKQNYASPLVAGPGVGAGVFGQTKSENRGNIVRAGLNYRF
jgi:outer membrane immunogenic protein